MNFAVNEGAQQRGPYASACFQTVDVRDRAVFGPADDIAPWAKTCLLVHPSPMTETYSGWSRPDGVPHPSRADVYGLYADDKVHLR